MNKEKNYIAFLLGYDLLNKEFSNSKNPECDIVYEKCNNIAEEFLNSKYNQKNKDLYSCLENYIKDCLITKDVGEEQPKDSLILIETLDDLKSEIETKGWRIEDIYVRSANSDGWELYQYSPAGQDFSFTILHNNDLETAVKEIIEYTEEGFDKDENIEMYIEARNNGLKGVPTTRELVQDADDIQNMLDSLNKHLSIDCVIHPSKDSVEVDKEDDLEPEM